MVTFESGCKMPKWYADAWRLPKEERSKLRSKTFPGIAKAMVDTLIAEHGFRHHFATDTFVTFCGRSNLYVRDYVEFIEGAIRKVGEGRQVFEAINESSMCKICLDAVKRHSC